MLSSRLDETAGRELNVYNRTSTFFGPARPKWVGPSRAPVGGPKTGPSGWAQARPGPSQAQAGPKPGPSRAQAGPKLGPSRAQAGPKPEIWDPKKSEKYKFSKSKPVSPKMSARSGLAGKRTSRPHLGPSQAIFCVGRKNTKNDKILPIVLGGPMGQWA